MQEERAVLEVPMAPCNVEQHADYLLSDLGFGRREGWRRVGMDLIGLNWDSGSIPPFHLQFSTVTSIGRLLLCLSTSIYSSSSFSCYSLD
jgi:hypothetical protein